MKQIFLLALCLICSSRVSAQFSGKGSGTSDDPYQITTADELFEVRNALSASYKLVNDIDLTEWIEENSPTQGWSPIGSNTNPFTGCFNGNGMTIKGLYVKRPNTDNLGLFGYVGYPGVITNVTLDTPEITGCNNIGALVGYSYGERIGYISSEIHPTITSNIIISPQIIGENYSGGIIGYAHRTILNKNCVIYPSITGNNYIGGIAGAHYSFDLQRYLATKDSICQNIVVGGSISGNQDIGGILGYSGFIYKSTTSSTNTSEVYIVSNYSSSLVCGTSNVGGISGRINSVYFPISGNGNVYQFLYNNHFAGIVQTQESSSAGIIGYLDLEIDKGGTTSLRKPIIYIYKNLCSGCVHSLKNASGIWGDMASVFRVKDSNVTYSISDVEYNNFKQNVFCGDTLSSLYTGSSVYRISKIEGTDNYALSNATLLVDSQPYLIEEDDAQQGIGYGKKTLMKQSTYEGIGFDFTNDWAIVEGETYPYNINQCRPATVTSFKSGTSGTIEGTAIGKSSQCNGNVYVSIGDNFYEGTVTNGQWSVQLGEVKEGAEAKVTVMVDGMMPSILTTAIAEKGTSTPVVDNTPDTDISLLSDVVYINNVETSVGTQLTLSVKMKNSVTAEGFGFDLYLPDGVTVAVDEDGFPRVELSTERTTARKTNSFDAAFQSDGSLRVLAASTNGSTISGNDGEVCLITINIANDMAEGYYPILLKNIAISDVDAVSHRTEQVKSTLTISAYTPGDANNDGVIDVSDFTATAHYLLGNAPTGFNVKAGDANGDSVVDVADLTAVAHIILYGSVNRPSSVRAYEMNEPQ